MANIEENGTRCMKCGEIMTGVHSQTIRCACYKCGGVALFDSKSFLREKKKFNRLLKSNNKNK